jgi:hypothetical protein
MIQQFDDATGTEPKPPRVYPGLNKKLLWLKWLALVSGVLMTCGGAYEYYRANQLREHGVKTEGTLFDSSVLNTGKGRRSYDVIVDYDAKENKQGYRKRFNVSEGVFNEITRTGKTTVTYLPSDPTQSAVGDVIKADTEPLAIGVGLFLVGIAVHFYLRRQASRLEAYVTGTT